MKNKQFKAVVNFFCFRISTLFLLILSFTISFSLLQVKDNKVQTIPQLIKWVGYGGYCTDWAYARWKEAHPGEELLVNGDAWEWYGYAKNHGMSTGTTPQVGAVVVWGKYVGGAADVGHVAFVEQIYSQNSFKVSEMNWDCGRGCRNDRNVTLTSDIHFIYSKNSCSNTVAENSVIDDGSADKFFFERGKKRYIPDMETVNQLSSRYGGSVVRVCSGVLPALPPGRQVPSVYWPNNHDNTLIKGSSSAVFVMKSGEKRFVSTLDQLDPDDRDFYYPSDIRGVTDYELNLYRTGPPIYQDGQTFGGYSGNIFFVERGKRRYVPTADTYNARGLNWASLVTLPDDWINQIPEGRALPNSTWPNNHDNILIKGSSSAVFVMKSGEKRFVSSFDQIDPDDHDFYYQSDLRVIPDTELDLYTMGAPIYQEGQSFRNYSNEIFIIERGKRRYVPSPETYNSRGFSWSTLIILPDEWINKIPAGRTLPDIIWPNISDNILLQENGSPKVWLMRDGRRNLLASFDQIDPIDGDWYYPSDIRQVSSLLEIPIQPLDTPLTLSVSRVYWGSRSDYLERKLSVDYVIKNTGLNDAFGVVITGSENTQKVTNITSLPLSIGDIPAGQQKVITIYYNVPVNTSRVRTNLKATANDFNEYPHIYPE